MIPVIPMMMMLNAKQLAPGAGYDWRAWQFAQVPPAANPDAPTSDANAVTLPDGGSLTSDAISLVGARGCEVSVWGAEADAGDVSGDLSISILRADGAGGYEVVQDQPWQVALNIERNRTRKKTISVSPEDMGSFKILLVNNSGQSLAITAKFRTAG
tara:strand:+ start:3147 stop:3617 length:471 start_codon:yes stop_codon:yes gene_type:complete